MGGPSAFEIGGGTVPSRASVVPVVVLLLSQEVKRTREAARKKDVNKR
jgi:hypothetical protein